MKTQEQILDRLRSIEIEDFFGVIRMNLVECLSYEKAKPFLNDGVTIDQWEPESLDMDAVLLRMRDYMDFAWEKANNNRGLSAARSICHMQAWLWLLDEDKVAEEIEDYSMYGKPQLRAICEHYGWVWQNFDDGRWANDEMSDGIKPQEAAILSWASYA